MRTAILLFALAFDGCGSTQHAPPVTEPPPVTDAGSACAIACSAAEQDCAHPVITVATCKERCASGLRYTKDSARCIARTSVCNAKDSCP